MNIIMCVYCVTALGMLYYWVMSYGDNEYVICYKLLLCIKKYIYIKHYYNITGLPTDVLGKEYYAVTWSPAYRKSEILVVGVHDSTTVNILFHNSMGSKYVTYDRKKYYKNQKLTVKMNRYKM